MRVSVDARDDMIDAHNANLNGGQIRIYDGVRPASPAVAITTQVLLATLTFDSPAFGASASATAAANAITADTNIDAQGTASWARLVTSGGAAVDDCTVGATGSGADIEFGSVLFQAGAQATMSSFTISMPLGS